jgi:hypothetical protein
MKTYTLELTEAEFSSLAGMIDAAVKAAGLRAVKDAAALVVKMEAAQAAAEKVIEHGDD